MVNEYFTYKEVVLGSRDDYLKIHTSLKQLKELIHIENKEIKDVNFELVVNLINKSVNLKPELVCRYVQELKNIKDIIIYFILQGKCCKNYSEISKIVNEGDKYIIKDLFDNYNVYDLNEFYYRIERILESDFVNKINFFINFCVKENKKVIEQLLILPSYIKYAEVGYNSFHNIYYDAKEDILYFESDKRISKEDILKYLNKEISSSVLSSYHTSIISNNSSISKEICIEDDFLDNRLCFGIVEDEDKIILHKTKMLKK